MNLYGSKLTRVCRPLQDAGWRFTINGPRHRVTVIAWWSLDRPRYTVKG